MTERALFAAILKSAKFEDIAFTNGNHYGSLEDVSPVWLDELAEMERPSDGLECLKMDLEDMLDKVNSVLGLLNAKKAQLEAV